MNPKHISIVANQLNLKKQQVHAVAELCEAGCTLPFLARYRKEATGGLDEAGLRDIRERLGRLADLEQHRQAILDSVEKQGKLTPELRERMLAADTRVALDDLHLACRIKPRTPAAAAREKGLEPLASLIFAQDTDNVAAEAQRLADARDDLDSADDALAGARDIVAEWVSEDAPTRARLRRLFMDEGVLRCRVAPGKENEAAKYRDYFNWEESAAKAPSHRVLAMLRGEKERLLTVAARPEDSKSLGVLEEAMSPDDGECSEQMRLALVEAYRLFLLPALERELKAHVKACADAEAIELSASNLRQLLLSPPLGSKHVLAVYPGLRAGCKVVCLDGEGNVLHHQVIFPHPPQNQTEESATAIRQLCERYRIEAIAVGGGRAGRETETFIRGLGLAEQVQIVPVEMTGVTAYAGSKRAKAELPGCDAKVRGAVFLGRRLMDPLAELVKVDPLALGLGQYHSDVNRSALKKRLHNVMRSCVNAVGVDVNTAGPDLLKHVSGVGESLARKIVEHRAKNGPFATREELKQVDGFTPKVFEQAAGFLRIRNGANPLDATAIHPESYPVVHAMAEDLGCTVPELMQPSGPREKLDLERYVSETTGLPTLKDIVKELALAGRDPRGKFKAFQFAESVKELSDLQPGMKLPGIVTNLTRFGAFVDVGVNHDGLVHVSQMADRYVKDPTKVVRVGQRVEVRVLEVDQDRKRISLTMRRDQKPTQRQNKKEEKKEEEKKPEPKKQRRPKPLDTERKRPSEQRPRRERRPQPRSDRRAPAREKPAEEPFNQPFQELLKKFRRS